MNQLHLARQLGFISVPGFQRIQNDWFINSVRPQSYTKSGSRSDTDTSNTSHITSHREAEQAVPQKAGINCLTIDNHDGRFLVSGGADAVVCLYDLETSNAREALRPTTSLQKSSEGSHIHSIAAVKFYPFDCSSLLSASHDKSVKLISVTATSLEPVHTFPLNYAPYTLALSHLPSANPLVAVGTAHPAIRLFDLRSGLGTHSLPGHSRAVYSITWSPRYEHLLASGGSDGRVLFFDIRRSNAAFGSLDLEDAIGVVGDDPRTGAGARRPLDWNARAHAGAVTGVQWTSGGDKLVTVGHDGRIRVFDAATGKNDLVHFGPRIRNHRAGTLLPLLSPHGHSRPGKGLLYWPNDDGKGDIHLHSLHEGNLLRVLSTPGVQRTGGTTDKIGKLTSGGRINALEWRVNAASGYGVELYSAHGDGRIRIWKPAEDDEDCDSKDKDNGETQQVAQQEQAQKRKRELVGALVASLSKTVSS